MGQYLSEYVSNHRVYTILGFIIKRHTVCKRDFHWNCPLSYVDSLFYCLDGVRTCIDQSIARKYNRGRTGKSYSSQMHRDEYKRGMWYGNGDHKAGGSRLEKFEEMQWSSSTVRQKCVE